MRLTVFYSDEMGDDWRERIFGWDKFCFKAAEVT